MSTIDYKQKYLKYKNKYLELKSLQESESQKTQTPQTPQTGGFVYAPGKYLFFIPQNKKNFDTKTPGELGPDHKTILVNTNGTIVGNLDNLTNYLGNCTKFLRVGKTSTGYDFANTYNTLYSNQSSGDVIKREAKPYIDTTKKVVEQSINTAIQTGKEIGEQAKKIMEKKSVSDSELSNSTIHSSDLENTNTENPELNKQELNKPVSTNQEPIITTGGGEGEEGEEGEGEENQCERKPIKLSKELLIGDINSVREEKLLQIVKLINDTQGTDPNNKISRIILVEKPVIPGKPSTIDLARNFSVLYQNNDISKIQKI